MNYDDNMSFEEECKVVPGWWRDRNPRVDPPPENKSGVRPKFVPSVMLLKKAVMALHRDEVQGVQSRIRNCNTACM